jgi:hypothetical protein
LANPPLTDVTGIIKNNIKAVATSGTFEVSNSCFIKNFKKSHFGYETDNKRHPKLYRTR